MHANVFVLFVVYLYFWFSHNVSDNRVLSFYKLYPYKMTVISFFNSRKILFIAANMFYSYDISAKMCVFTDSSPVQVLYQVQGYFLQEPRLLTFSTIWSNRIEYLYILSGNYSNSKTITVSPPIPFPKICLLRLTSVKFCCSKNAPMEVSVLKYNNQQAKFIESRLIP